MSLENLALSTLHRVVTELWEALDAKGMLDEMPHTRTGIRTGLARTLETINSTPPFVPELAGDSPPRSSAPTEAANGDAGAGARVSAGAVETARHVIADAIEALATANGRTDALEAKYERLAMELHAVDRVLCDLADAQTNERVPNDRDSEADDLIGNGRISVRALRPEYRAELEKSFREARGILEAVPGPAEQRRIFESVLAEPQIPATTIKAALERIDGIIALISGESWSADWTGLATVDLRAIAGMLDKVSCERVDLSLKLEEATRWERNPRRRTTLEEVRAVAEMIRVGNSLPSQAERDETAEAVEALAAELIAMDRQLHEATEAKRIAIAERDELGLTVQAVEERLAAMKTDLHRVQENTATYRQEARAQVDAANADRDIARAWEKRLRDVLAQLYRPPANVERLYDRVDELSSAEAAEVAMWTQEVHGRALRFLAELATMTDVECEFADGFELRTLAMLLQVPGEPVIVPRLYGDQDRDRAAEIVRQRAQRGAIKSDQVDATRGYSTGDAYGETVDAVAEALGMRKAGA